MLILWTFSELHGELHDPVTDWGGVAGGGGHGSVNDGINSPSDLQHASSLIWDDNDDDDDDDDDDDEEEEEEDDDDDDDAGDDDDDDAGDGVTVIHWRIQ